MAKTPDAKTHLGLQFYNKTTQRKYNALVWGLLDADNGTIEGNITRNPRTACRWLSQRTLPSASMP